MLFQVILLEKRLTQVFIMTRHGIRTPVKAYKNDDIPWNCSKNHLYNFQYQKNLLNTKDLKLNFDLKNHHKGNCFKCQLTDDGYDQHANLSNIWQAIYPELYQAADLRSTVVPRVQLSLVGQLTQRSSGSQLNKSINLVHVATKYMDSGVVSDNCSWNSQYMQNTRKLLNTNAIKAQSTDDLKKMQSKAGFGATWNFLGDYFKAKRASHLFIPHFTDFEISNSINNMDAHWRHEYVTPHSQHVNYLKLSIGSLMKDIIRYQMIQRSVIVSGHDSGLAPLIAVLVNNDEWSGGQPEFASFIAIELYFENGVETVKIRLRNSGVGTGEYVKQSACGQLECGISAFQEYILGFEVSIEERTRMCKEKFQEEQYE
ncbi:Acid_phosphatase [Hexamita inflata]|uniref:Acid phosphatase n=1 Tax=Hexamita inflata TaxID=28002 RepID=A0AA86NHP8_9EUKA|nr:Acid phosphatase [Hexamita inflata]